MLGFDFVLNFIVVHCDYRLPKVKGILMADFEFHSLIDRIGAQSSIGSAFFLTPKKTFPNFKVDGNFTPYVIRWVF